MAVQPETLDAFDDRQLVEAFQAGDEGAFARIVEVYYAPLMAEARRRLGPNGDAEDAVQETLIRAYMALDRFGEDYHLRAWLGRILANACADVHARRASDVRLQARIASQREVASGPDDLVGDDHVRRFVQEAVASLPEAYRAAFVLRAIEERSYAEVAQKLDVTEDNARARVHRARGALQRSLQSVERTLGAFLIPLRLLWRPRRSADLSLAGQVFGEGAPPNVSSVSQTALLTTQPTPISQLSQLSQTLAQVAASPVSQTVLAAAPDAGRASLPVAGALASLAAAGAAMVGGGGMVSQPVAAPIPTLSAPAPQTQDALASYAQGPAADSQGMSASTATTPSSSSSSSSPALSPPSTSSSSPSSSQSTVKATSSAPPGGANVWSWVTDAAGGTTTGQSSSASFPSGTSSSSASVPSDTSATAMASSSNASSSSSSSSSGSASTGSNASSLSSSSSSGSASTSPSSGSSAADCPFTTSFPLAAAGPVLVSPPLPANGSPSAYLVTPNLTLPGDSSAIQAQGEGTTFEGDDSGTVEVYLGVCLSGTNDPMLIANLVNEDSTSPYVFQLRAGLVDSSISGPSEASLYRGTGTWLDGPDVTSAPVPFVAQVATPGVSALQVAFFAPIPGLVGPPATTTDCTGGDQASVGNQTNSTTSCPDGAAGTSSSSQSSGTGDSDSLGSGGSSGTGPAADSSCSGCSGNAAPSTDASGGSNSDDSSSDASQGSGLDSSSTSPSSPSDGGGSAGSSS